MPERNIAETDSAVTTGPISPESIVIQSGDTVVIKSRDNQYTFTFNVRDGSITVNNS